MGMNETPALALAGMAGLLLGGVFFGGLWWTVQKSVSSRRPALLFVGSMLLRTSLVVAGFYFVGRGHLDLLLMCLFGFTVARPVVSRLTRPVAERTTRPAGEAPHAP
jgi:F1F0 ATPase subunit 2